MASSARDSGDNDYFVAITDRRAKPASEADVLIIQVVRDERIRVPTIIDKAGTEAGIARGDIGDDVAEGTAGTFDSPVPIGQPGEDIGKRNRNWHEDSKISS
jgi:hypothetical protein